MRFMEPYGRRDRIIVGIANACLKLASKRYRATAKSLFVLGMKTADEKREQDE